ncbi:L-glutamate gamma-semialdehyde dehydrogenase [Saccharicrinis fermentans]|uniref:L-glutamate gamma-semialdehyde dehydrogenase n=1 Tax=Saccharicrinis fermentans DSM 9555 = JCM 21142 TaxID=869213 RepID=W7Y616_9BACT|nr:L-glutamate gamma-semialdehyde dehydrogenase [Saccharicrinis fermentans]GAF03577.1 1-pyrroline-5-carboxylate dehydrogenase 1 [Saccharicrinis fermentans DSM 9555 = JCM 21142]
MPKGIFNVPLAENEPVLSYAPGTPEREALQAQLKAYKQTEVDIPMYIGGQEVRTGNKVPIHPPHDIKHCLGYYHQGDETHVHHAIEAALTAKEKWASLSWEHRAAIFLKAADLVSGPYRQKLNAATMLGQSKNAFQAEIDAACEFADFLRFNVQYMTDIYADQPESAPGMWNRVEYRPLEGFVFALTPFNFTSIAGNLPTAPALMGNTVVWKPSKTAIYSAQVLMELFNEAGVPAGVINLVYASGPVAAKVIFDHPEFAGIHFTGSTAVFQSMWKTIGGNIEKYKSYPRIVGETGGKDFIIAHQSCDAKAVATGIVRGGFEFQGQKCSAASRVYLPASRWEEIKGHIATQMSEIKMGDPEDFSNFVNAVIDESSFDKLAGAIDHAKASQEADVIFGGNYDKSKGYFIEPTIIQTSNPQYITMKEELFGPVVTLYVYEDAKFEETMDILDKTSMYALTGAIFSQDRYAAELATKRLVNCAGNFYINDKPTGAVVGQQPFGGARGSGTNDKAGSAINLMRWVSPRTIKETFVPAQDYKYPFLG